MRGAVTCLAGLVSTMRVSFCCGLDFQGVLALLACVCNPTIVTLLSLACCFAGPCQEPATAAEGSRCWPWQALST
jgi:hypothetical protein